MMIQTKGAQAALHAYRRACESHKRADWRMACHLLAAVVQGAEPKPAKAAPKPRTVPTLCEFLAVKGIRDTDGELQARGADRWHRARPFQRRLVRPDGVTVEAAAEAAWEAGYFPHVAPVDMSTADNMHPVTPQMLIDAIDRELGGKVVAPWQDPGDDYWHALEDFERAELVDA